MCAVHFKKTIEKDKTFNPNICYICLKEDNGNFITCDQCNMISYCSIEHRSIHKEHMDICAVIQKLLKKHPQLWPTPKLNLEQWIQTRKEFIRLIKLELERDLKPYEVEMIKLAKSCVVCHQQVNLNVCVRCYCVNYCPDHDTHLKNHYISNCKDLRLCNEINIYLSIHKDVTIKFMQFPHKSKPVIDMITFINQFVSPYLKIHTAIDNISCWIPRDYFYSDYASGPLTLHFGIQKMKKFGSLDERHSHFVIHVIAANFVDRQHIAAWELLLHVLPNMLHFIIILIDPEMRSESEDIKLCYTRCSQFHRKLSFETYNMLYHNYVDSESYKKPHVITGFQTDLSDWEELSQTILKVQSQNCSLLLTAKSKLKADENISKISEVLHSPKLNIIYNDENKFSSRRPYRDLEDSVFYRNKYLTIYQKL